MKDVFEAVDAAVAVSFDLAGDFKAKIAEARSEIARLEVENVSCEAGSPKCAPSSANSALFKSDCKLNGEGRLAMPGREARTGCGAKRARAAKPGPEAAPAPAIVEWRPDPEAFTVQAILGDGSVGPMIALRSLFESYHAATSWIEDADLVQAAHESRQAAEQEAEASRWASR